MGRSSSLVAPAKRFTVNGRLATGNGTHTVVWGLELRAFVPAGMVAAAYDFEDESAQLTERSPAELEQAPTKHGHDRHVCPVCGNAMWSGGFSLDDTVSCGACSYRAKRTPGKDYDPCQGARCTSRVPM